jgi:hypothetical protein
VAASIFLHQGTIVEYHLSSSTDIGHKIGATNFLLHRVALFFSKQATILHLGGGLTTDINDSLYVFKSSIGKTRFKYYIGKLIFDIERYHHIKNSNCTNNSHFRDRVIFYR